MFLLSFNETTGNIEIFCTECYRFIDGICVANCPMYDDFMEQKKKRIKELLNKEYGYHDKQGDV